MLNKHLPGDHSAAEFRYDEIFTRALPGVVRRVVSHSRTTQLESILDVA
ncbi:MAG: hypothetical protein ACFCUG_12420 [Thiotrichales bacterium]